MTNEIWPVVILMLLAGALGIVFGGSIATSAMEKKAINHNVGYYNPTNRNHFEFVTLTNSPVTINK